MSRPAIRVEGLGKRFRIGERLPYKSLRESIMRSLSRRLSGAPRKSRPTIWALRDVSFEIGEGEVVGIIGRNGAGKSTLLKILSRITEPTEGRVELHGRVGSLLEVGTGFHQELTGRENIFLNGAILGMKRVEIERKFDEIVAFAEVENFIDTPVKHFSSGMYLRLAFAVAAHLDPEILLVDEVLAVGDAAFQKKCLGKMGDVSRAGRTVLFVSHNLGAVVRLCERSLLVESGRLAADGPSIDVTTRYQSQVNEVKAQWVRTSAAGDRPFDFLYARVCKPSGEAASSFLGNEDIRVEVGYNVKRHLAACQVGVRVNSADGVTVFTTSDADATGSSALAKKPATYRATFVIPGHLLAPGVYSLYLAAHAPGRTLYDHVDLAVVFEISSTHSLVSLDNRLGVVAPMIRWSTSEASP